MGCDKKFQGERTYLVAAAMMLALAGCDAGESDDGGGSISYTGPTEAVSVTNSAEAKTVSVAAVGYMTGNPMPQALDGAIDGLAKTEVATVDGSNAVELVRQRLIDTVRRQRASGLSLLGASSTESCSGGGTATFDADMADETEFAVGDRFSITYDNCTEALSYASVEIDGNIAMTVTSVSGDPLGDTGSWALGLKTVFDGLKLSYNITVDGESTTYTSEYGGALTQTEVVMNWVERSLTTTGSSLVIKSSDGTETRELKVSDFSLQRAFDDVDYDASSDSDLTVAATFLGGSFTVETTTPFRWSPAYSLNDVDGSPDEGVMVITAGSAKVKVALETYGYVEVYEDLDGDGTWEGHTQYPEYHFFF